jgi:hypothetical protein
MGQRLNKKGDAWIIPGKHPHQDQKPGFSEK